MVTHQEFLSLQFSDSRNIALSEMLHLTSKGAIHMHTYCRMNHIDFAGNYFKLQTKAYITCLGYTCSICSHSGIATIGSLGFAKFGIMA